MRNWCFTKYDLAMPDLDPTLVRYCVYQRELCPDTGREHLQGYIEFKKSIRMNAVKAFFGDTTIHLEARRGTREEAREYCMKDDTRIDGTIPIEFGEFVSRQGRRSDLEDVYASIAEGNSVDYIAENFPIEYMKYSKQIKEMVGVIRNRTECRAMIEEFETVTLRPWQEECVTEIENQNEREVLWITDREGGKGKSWLTKYLKLKCNAFVVTGGNHNDIAFDYDYQKIVVFDLARESQFMPYSLIENFKNGLIFSAKYESKMKFSRQVKVVIFSNNLPDMSKLSGDRWNVKEL